MKNYVPMKLVVPRKFAHILNLPWFEKNQCICSKQLHSTCPFFVNLSLSVVFQAEKMVPSPTFADGLQTVQLLVQEF